MESTWERSSSGAALFVTRDFRPVLSLKVHRNSSGEAFRDWRRRTIAAPARTGQSIGWPERDWVTLSSRRSLFWCSKVMVMAAACSRRALSCGMIMLCRSRNSRFRSRRGFVRRSACWMWRYSQLRMAKKKASKVSWWKAVIRGMVVGCITMSCSTFSGMAFWCLVAGSLFLCPRNCRCKMIAVLPSSSREGLCRPLATKAVHAPSTAARHDPATKVAWPFVDFDQVCSLTF